MSDAIKIFKAEDDEEIEVMHNLDTGEAPHVLIVIGERAGILLDKHQTKTLLDELKLLYQDEESKHEPAPSAQSVEELKSGDDCPECKTGKITDLENCTDLECDNCDFIKNESDIPLFNLGDPCPECDGYFVNFKDQVCCNKCGYINSYMRIES